ncbi:MAG: hypothetical protein F6J93_20850 [Oscillatoria sp. SIO1A7]|nr:hypothetical protein [Oscillatoria sp. SIO1A7]
MFTPSRTSHAQCPMPNAQYPMPTPTPTPHTPHPTPLITKGRICVRTEP